MVTKVTRDFPLLRSREAWNHHERRYARHKSSFVPPSLVGLLKGVSIRLSDATKFSTRLLGKLPQ